jgi:hypothetical protein
MSVDDQRDALLSRLPQGADVIHLPYTGAFENLCAELLGRPASTDEKHDIWEALLRRQVSSPTRGQTPDPPSATASSTTPPSFPTYTAPRPDRRQSWFSFAAPLPAPPIVSLQQPWTVPAEPALSDELQEERDRILADVADSRLGGQEQRITFLLARFPETRDSDVALYIRYWGTFQADVIARWHPLELEILYELDRPDSLSRMRRHIQNKLRLYRGMEATAERRDQLQKELHEYLQAHKGIPPEVRLYLDETGNEGDKTLAGIGGICVMNWQQYAKYAAALAQWRRELNCPDTIHFADTASYTRMNQAVRLLAELQVRRSGLLFLGYALASRGRTHQDLFSLYVQLAMDTLRHMRASHCLDEPRSLRIIKEADPGFDRIYLEKMKKELK